MKLIALTIACGISLGSFASGEGAGPLPPVLVSPANGATGQALNVKLDWNAVPNVMLYAWELDTTPNFNSGLFQSGSTNYINTSNNNTDTEHQCTGLITGLKYYWRVRCADSQGGISAWSQLWSFTTQLLSVTSLSKGEIGFSVSLRDQSLSLNFATTINDEVTITVYNMLGEKVVVVKEWAGARIAVNLQRDPEPGIYFINVETGASRGTRKLVVSR